MAISLIVCIVAGIVYVVLHLRRVEEISDAVLTDFGELGRLAFVAGLLAFLLRG
jgi:hypothetical protein